jgi:hypothetical protein
MFHAAGLDKYTLIGEADDRTCGHTTGIPGEMSTFKMTLRMMTPAHHHHHLHHTLLRDINVGIWMSFCN